MAVSGRRIQRSSGIEIAVDDLFDRRLNLLFPELLHQELENRREEFTRLAQARAESLSSYGIRFGQIANASDSEFDERIGAARDCGAYPSDELFHNRSFAIPFPEKWTNHEEARSWAKTVLENRTTFAADGSQIFAEREFSVPVAGVQIGWFENDHREGGSYSKHARFVILSPKELLSQDEPAIPETRVSERRFREEIRAANEFLERKKGWKERGERMPLAFYDGTIFLSIGKERTSIQNETVALLVKLVRASEDARVPIAGFVDRSFARDLLTMADRFAGADESGRSVDDVSVLERFLPADWGIRTPFFFCRRHGLGEFFDEARGESIAGFVYLRTTESNPPARIDLPRWIFDDGLLPEVIDVIRAECVVGVGYPYPIEAADQTAVISMADRQVFLNTLFRFGAANQMEMAVSRKAASKGRRR